MLRDKDVTEYYRRNRDAFRQPEMVRVAHIIRNAEGEAEETTALAAMESIVAQLRSGAKFEELADRYSDCPGGGGDLGWFARGQMVEEFERVVFALAIGGISSIFRTPFGFHIARLLDRTPARIRSLEEVRPEIEQALS